MVLVYFKKYKNVSIVGAGLLILTLGLIFTFGSHTEIYNITYPLQARSHDNQSSVPAVRDVEYSKPREPLPGILLDVSHSSDLDARIDNMTAGPLPLLSEYRSPCWYEPLNATDPYQLRNGHLYQQYFAHLPDRRASFTRALKANVKIFEARLRSSESTWRIRCLPYIYLVGINRGGSTALWGSLNAHPHIVSGPRKELHYWNELRIGEGLDKMGYARFERYITHIPTPRPMSAYLDVLDKAADIARTTIVTQADGSIYHPIAIGDATPNYLTDWDHWEKLTANEGLNEPRYTLAHIIKMLTPHAKIVAVLRDPVKRLISEYLSYMGNAHKSPEAFHDLVTEAVSLITECLRTRTLRSCVYDLEIARRTQPVILKHSLYYPFVRDWMEVFGREQFYILTSEEYYGNPNATSQKIFSFLGLKPHGVRKGTKNQVHGKAPKMKSETLTLLYDFFRPYNEQLADYLNDPKYLWKQSS